MRSESLARIGILPVPAVRVESSKALLRQVLARLRVVAVVYGPVDLRRVVTGSAGPAGAPTSGNPVLVCANMVHQPGTLTFGGIVFVNQPHVIQREIKTT